MAIEKFDHVGVMVKDLDASISFYQDIIGLDVMDKSHPTPAIKVALLGCKKREEVIIKRIQGSKHGLPTEGKVNHTVFIQFIYDTMITIDWLRMRGLVALSICR